MRNPSMFRLMEPDAESVSVRVADGTERRLIENLIEFYIYEFMRLEPPCSTRLDDWDCYPAFSDLDRYWRIEGFRPLLICVKERLAGFALINTHSRRGEKVEFNMAEFFIAREHRGRGIATDAVRLVMAQYAGRWEIAAAEHNLAAKIFWPRTLAVMLNVSHLVRYEGDGERWRGPIWSFRTELEQSRNFIGPSSEPQRLREQVHEAE
jgi:predicted acetyltransferase